MWHGSAIRHPKRAVAQHFSPASVSIEADGPDACIVTAGADDPERMVFYFATIGHDFEILEPPEVARAVVAVANGCAAPQGLTLSLRETPPLGHDSRQARETAMSWDELPATITTYLTAHRARDVATAITAFTADAVVTDEGHTYRGRDTSAIGCSMRPQVSPSPPNSSAQQRGTRRTSTSCNTWKGTSRVGPPTCTSVSPWMAH